MSIIVEDGTGKADAESYITSAYADSYHSLRGNTAWAALTLADKEINLRHATEYMVGKYRLKWKGTRTNKNQALDWPRAGVVIEDAVGGLAHLASAYGYYELDYNTVPIEIKNACAELAIRASISTLVKDQSQGVLSETIGPVKVVYDKDSPMQTEYTQIERMISPFLRNCGPSIKLTRV